MSIHMDFHRSIVVDEARAMLREAADQGHMKAQFHCGVMYDFGYGVAKDDRLALMYYEKAARQGNSYSQFNAGNNYYHGRGCEQSYERAAEWYEKAAQWVVQLLLIVSIARPN